MENKAACIYNQKAIEESSITCTKLRRKKREEAKDKSKYKGKKKNKTEAFHSFFQAIVPLIKEIWTDRCIDRNTPVVGGWIVAEYDALSKRVTQLYRMR
jgi:hypothetical protein